jgi:hypothetical protein
VSEPVARIAALLHEAGETHHLVYRIVDGEDPDWASWYADWLLKLSELPRLLATTPVRSELVWMLVELDSDYTAASAETPWPEWYAARIVERFGAATTSAESAQDLGTRSGLEARVMVRTSSGRNQARTSIVASQPTSTARRLR